MIMIEYNHNFVVLVKGIKLKLTFMHNRTKKYLYYYLVDSSFLYLVILCVFHFIFSLKKKLNQNVNSFI